MSATRPHRRWRLFILLVAAAALVGVAGVGAWEWQDRGMEGTAEWASIHDAPTVEASKQMAMTIVAAIERFGAEHGGPPESLAELTPGYLSSIPLPTAGRAAWKYRREKNGYTLRFGAGSWAYPGYYYESATGAWKVDF